MTRDWHERGDPVAHLVRWTCVSSGGPDFCATTTVDKRVAAGEVTKLAVTALMLLVRLVQCPGTCSKRRSRQR